MLRCLAAAVVLASALAALPESARAADPVPQRDVGFGVKNGHLTVSVGLQDLFGDAERARLKSGFATRVLIRAALEEVATGDPVAVAVQRAEIVYDIWDEKFAVRTSDGMGAERRSVVATPEQAIGRAAVLLDLPVIEGARLRPGAAYVLAVRGDLDPISEDLLIEVRRWLVQPARGQRRLGAGDSFFGSFVSIFVNPRIEDSERQVRFASQPFIWGPAPQPPPAPPPPKPQPGRFR
ncbi:MAG TPA: hypothetical protein VN853_18305 [Polyangia bacterium]|nr:hypothetical protein [Polyangia bacterium]